MEKKIRRLIESKEMEILKLKDFLRDNNLNQSAKAQIEEKIAFKQEILEELKEILTNRIKILPKRRR